MTGSAALAVALGLALVAADLPARADESPPPPPPKELPTAPVRIGSTKLDLPRLEPPPEREPGQHGSLWPMAGAATAVGALTLGGVLIAQDDHPDAQKVGTVIAALGFAIAPFIAHTRSGHCNRALIFGLASVASSIGLIATMGITDPYNPQTRNHDRIPFGIAMTTAFFITAAGIVDGFLAAPDSGSRP